MSKKYDTDFLGFNGFIWFFGVVEDNVDPLKTGRIKVRCIEWHTNDKGKLPTDDLPWAQVMMPVNSSSNSGVGESPTGIQNGSWVVGFFMDGEKANRPLIIGTIPGIPMAPANPDVGFNDPEGEYPKKIFEPDTNQLARNDFEYQHPMINQKEAYRELGIPIANKGSAWDEPSGLYNARYPDNDVYEGKINDGNLSGVVREYDNTPGNERIHHYHPTGSFSEFNALGNHHQRIVGQNYEIIAGSDFVYVKGNANLTIDGNCHTHIEGNWDIFVGGYKREIIGGKLTQQVGEDADITTGGDTNMSAGGNMDMLGSRIDLNKGAGGLLGGLLSAAISFGIGQVLNSIGASMMESLSNVTQGLTEATNVAGALNTGGNFAQNFATNPMFQGQSLSKFAGQSMNLGGAAAKLGGGLASTSSLMAVGGVPSNFIGPTAPAGLFGNKATLAKDLAKSVQQQTNTLTRGINAVNTIKSFVKPAVDFAAANISGGNLVGAATGFVKNVGISLAGDMFKTFSGIEDFKNQITDSFEINETFGPTGAKIINTAFDNVFNPANVLNGFDVDIFKDRTLNQVKQVVANDFGNLATEKINAQFDTSIQEYFNVQTMFRSVIDADFVNVDPIQMIEASLNTRAIAEKAAESLEPTTGALSKNASGLRPVQASNGGWITEPDGTALNLEARSRPNSFLKANFVTRQGAEKHIEHNIVNTVVRKFDDALNETKTTPNLLNIQGILDVHEGIKDRMSGDQIRQLNQSNFQKALSNYIENYNENEYLENDQARVEYYDPDTGKKSIQTVLIRDLLNEDGNPITLKDGTVVTMDNISEAIKEAGDTKREERQIFGNIM